MLPDLLKRGFPAADVTTGMFDLDEIDRWRARRHTPAEAPPAAAEEGLSMGERFVIAHRRRADAHKKRSP